MTHYDTNLEDCNGYLDMAKEMLRADDRNFTEWEINFLEHISNWDGLLTVKQKETIKKIYREKM